MHSSSSRAAAPIARLETAVMGACCSRASDDVDGDDDDVVARDVSDAFHEATCDAFVIDWDGGATEEARVRFRDVW